jgi:hypothetical protein
LPAGWSVLYCLAQIDRRTLEDWIGDGTIHPSLTLRQARELSARFHGRLSTSSRPPILKRRVHSFQNFVRANWANWFSSERDWCRAELNELLSELRRERPASAPAPEGFSMTAENSCPVPLTTCTVSL